MPAASSVEVTSFAVVTQASGEDWSNAELAFSSQSSTAAVHIPELSALTLGDTRAATQTVERQSASFSRAETAFRGQNRLWNLRLQGAEHGHAFEEIYKTNFEALQVVQSKTVAMGSDGSSIGGTRYVGSAEPRRLAAFGARSTAHVAATTIAVPTAAAATSWPGSRRSFLLVFPGCDSLARSHPHSSWRATVVPRNPARNAGERKESEPAQPRRANRGSRRSRG